MASVAIMAGGALLNAVAFIRQLSCSLSLRRRSQFRKALESNQAAYAKYQVEGTHSFDWMAINDRIKQQAKENGLRF